MKRIILFVLLVVKCHAINVDSIQTYETGTNGASMANSVAAAGAVGSGTWTFGRVGSSTGWFFVNTNLPLAWPFPVTVSGQTYTTVSTNWLAFGQNSSPDEDQLLFQPPGGQSAPYSNMVVRFYFRSTMNNSGADCNYDIGEGDGNGGGTAYGIIQQAVRNGQCSIYAHTAGGGGTNGLVLNYRSNAVYFVEYARALHPNRLCSVRMFDMTNSFLELTNVSGVNASTSTFGATTNTYQFFLQAGYLNAGTITGTNYFSSVSVSFSNEIYDPTAQLPIPLPQIYYTGPMGRRGFQ